MLVTHWSKEGVGFPAAECGAAAACDGGSPQWFQMAKNPPKTRFKISWNWLITLMPGIVWKNVNMKCLQWPKMESIWIWWNLFGKFCQITSSELVFGLVLDIWNHCAAASEVRSLLILLEAPARQSLVAAAAVRTGGYRGVPRTAPHTPPLCRGAQHHQAISTPPRGCWC